MVCNSLSVTKALVTNEQLVKLLRENPQEVARLLQKYLEEKQIMASVRTVGSQVVVASGYAEHRIVNGVLKMGLYADSTITKALEEAVPMIADLLLADNLGVSMQSMGVQISGREMREAEMEGKTSLATFFTAKFGRVSFRVVVLPGGQVQILGDKAASFNESKGFSETLLREFKEAGIQIQQVGQVETHRASVSHVHLTNRQMLQQ